MPTFLCFVKNITIKGWMWKSPRPIVISCRSFMEKCNGNICGAADGECECNVVKLEYI